MKFFILLKQSFVALMSNKVRSFLTVIGVIIGIGSVIALTALGAGVKESISAQVSSLGSTTLTVIAGESPTATLQSAEQKTSSGGGFGSAGSSGQSFGSTTQTLTKADLTSIETANDSSIKDVSGTVSTVVIIDIDNVQTRHAVSGVSPVHFAQKSVEASSGVLFTEDNRSEKVIVLGSKVAGDLFPDTDPVSKIIKIGATDFTVIGVLLEQKESNISSNNSNTSIFVPDYTALEVFKTNFFTSFTVTASADDQIDNAKNKIQDLILASHGITDVKLKDFSVITSEDLLSTVNTITTLLTSLLAGIAAISLLVGGIGIMNIMLVSVTERTREIGLRKAVGANTGDILLQFLIEAVLVTLIGGILGLLSGYGLSQLAGKLLGFSGIITTDSIILAVGVSSIIGIVFGIYPAAKAARLNPIDALRYE
ncbi:MAG: ABC transporter permease [Candidatus Dojkabacteria bacterium]